MIFCFFKNFKEQGLHHCPGHPIPVLAHSFHEEILSDIQSKLSLVQPEAFSLCSITYRVRKETDSLYTAALQIAVENNEVSPHPLQTKELQFLQHLLITLVF